MVTFAARQTGSGYTESFQEISGSKAHEERVNIAVHIIEQKSGHFDPKESPVTGTRKGPSSANPLRHKVRGEKPLHPRR